jgi:hypothetical protein
MSVDRLAQGSKIWASAVNPRHWCVALITLVLALTAAETGAVALAKVGGEPITDTNLFVLASNRGLLRGIRFQDTALVRTLVEEMIVDELVNLESREVSLDRDYAYRSRAVMEVTDAALGLQAIEVTLPSLSIDSTLIDSFYRANIDRYTVPRPQRWVRQITVYKPGTGVPDQYGPHVDSLYAGWDCKRKIDSIYTRLADGEDFTELAVAHSEELTARQLGGDLGWVSEFTLREPAIRDWLFSLPPFLISRPFETDFGWHIGQVRDVRDAGPAGINPVVEADIRASLQVELGKRIAAEITDSVFSEAMVEYNEDVLSLPDSEIAPGMVMAIVNHRDTLWGAGYFLRKNARTETRLASLDAEGKRDLVRPTLQHMCLAQWVGAQGYLDRPEVRAVRDRLRTQEARAVVYARFASANVEADSAELRNFYRSHIQDFTPSRRHLVQRRRVSTMKEADSLAAQWKAGRVEMADRQWVGPDDLPRSLWNRIAAVPPGTVIGPLAEGGGFEVIHLAEIAQPKPFELARTVIAARIRDSRRDRLRQEFVREATRKYGVQRFTGRFGGIEFPTYSEFNAPARRDSVSARAADAE